MRKVSQSTPCWPRRAVRAMLCPMMRMGSALLLAGLCAAAAMADAPGATPADAGSAPASVREEFTNPVQLGFCGALPVGMGLLAAGVAPYWTGGAEGRLLIDAMVREHVLIKRLVALVRGSDDPAAAAYGRAVFEVFTSHQDKENDVVLPLLVESPGVSLTEVLAGAHGHQLGGRPHHHHH